MTAKRRQPKGLPVGGQFAASAKNAAEIGALTDPGADRPLSAAEFGAATTASGELARLEVDDIVALPDGSTVEVIPDDSPDAVVGDIVEAGTYLRTFPADASGVGHTTVVGFADLTERQAAGQELAFDAVRRGGAQVNQTSQGVDTDPFADPSPQQAAPAPGETPAPAPRRGTRVGDDGALYVDDPNSFWHGTEIISTYTRAQALADGALRDRLGDGTDLNQMARQAGIPVDVAFTAAAFSDSIAWNDDNTAMQDEAGRAWDVLWMANLPIRAHARRSNGHLEVGERIPFTFVRVPNTKRATQPRKQTLVAVFGTDDHGEPCFTIMMEDED